MNDRVLLTDFLVHVRDRVRRSRYGRRMTICGLLVPDGSRGVHDPTTCVDCKRLTPVDELAPETPIAEPDVLDIRVRCAACGQTQLEQLVGDTKARDALAAITCQSCGRTGGFAITRRPPGDEQRDERATRRDRRTS
jgi:hypothetical protein